MAATPTATDSGIIVAKCLPCSCCCPFSFVVVRDMTSTSTGPCNYGNYSNETVGTTGNGNSDAGKRTLKVKENGNNSGGDSGGGDNNNNDGNNKDSKDIKLGKDSEGNKYCDYNDVVNGNGSGGDDYRADRADTVVGGQISDFYKSNINDDNGNGFDYVAMNEKNLSKINSNISRANAESNKNANGNRNGNGDAPPTTTCLETRENGGKSVRFDENNDENDSDKDEIETEYSIDIDSNFTDKLEKDNHYKAALKGVSMSSNESLYTYHKQLSFKQDAGGNSNSNSNQPYETNGDVIMSNKM